jgi:hypothetical protein
MTLKIQQLRKELTKQAKKDKLEIVPSSSVVSWLFPGQFSYCLNEEFIWKKYGSLIGIKNEIHFHKIQPAIRWDDFSNHYLKKEKNNHHLAYFDMVTIGGGHIISKEKLSFFSEKVIQDLMEFLINNIGLKKENFIITYFPGEKLSEIGKNKKGFPKYDFDYDFPEDKDSKNIFLKMGFKEKQLKRDSSRNCFLLSDWVCGEIAPWGYRNEIHYKTKSGLLDIATIERLLWEPIYKNGKIDSIRKWNKVFVIGGSGFERLSLLTNNLKKIQEVENIKELYDFIKTLKKKNIELITESIRLVHRIVTDTNGNLSDERSIKKPKERIEKFNKIKRNLIDLRKEELEKAFKINAKINPWHPGLKKSIKSTIEVIEKYKESQKDWKEVRKNK